MIEIGANVGVFTTAMGLLFRLQGKDVSRIVAFEPAASSCTRLRQNLKLNGLGAVRVVQAAVSDHDGTAAFFEASPMATTSSLHRGFAASLDRPVGETVVQTVDGAGIGAFVPGAANVLVKIDAEGHEETILSRLGGFVREHRPDLIVEVLRRTAVGIAAATEGWGYRAFRIRPHGLTEEPLSAADHHSRDWLLTPAA
ncbi:MAG: FkbM family methyltransferase [Bauldia sp.]|nr:FkbM family methyltransferase [Bauldia sp.]